MKSKAVFPGNCCAPLRFRGRGRRGSGDERSSPEQIRRWKTDMRSLADTVVRTVSKCTRLRLLVLFGIVRSVCPILQGGVVRNRS